RRDVGSFVFGSAVAAVAFGVLDLRVEEGLTQFLIRERHGGRVSRVRPALWYAVFVDGLSGALIFTATVTLLTTAPLHLGHESVRVAVVISLALFIGVSD